MNLWENCRGFQWDAGNQDKNWTKHQVRMQEAEQVFFNQPLVVSDDAEHSSVEKRYFALGQANTQRKLTLIFTIRDNEIRIISARDMSKKERNIYGQ